MRNFDKYIMFLSEQYESADAEVEGEMPEIKLDMEDEAGLSEEEKLEKFEQLEDILKALITDEEEREELVQKIAVAADLEEEIKPEDEETYEGETHGEGEAEAEEKPVIPNFLKKKKAKKKDDSFPAFGSESAEALGK